MEEETTEFAWMRVGGSRHLDRGTAEKSLEPWHLDSRFVPLWPVPPLLSTGLYPISISFCHKVAGTGAIWHLRRRPSIPEATLPHRWVSWRTWGRRLAYSQVWKSQASLWNC